MVRKIVIALVTVTALCGALSAQETGQSEVFLSLTRKAEAKSSLPTNVKVITADEIREKGAKNVGECLQDEPDITISKRGTSGSEVTAMVRGASTEQTLVLIDGMRMNSIDRGLADLSTIPVENIERIEIIRGGASAMYGTSAFGGVINIITKKPSENMPLADATASAGSFGQQNYKLNLGVNRENTYALVTAGKDRSDGWRKFADSDINDFSARLGYRSEKLGQFDMSGALFNSDLGTPGQVWLNGKPLAPDQYNGTVEKEAATPGARQKENKNYLRMEYSRGASVNHFRSAIYASRDKIRNNDPVYMMDTENNATVYGAEAQYDMRWGLTLGVEHQQERLEYSDLLDRTNNDDHSRANTAGYLCDTIKTGRLTVIPAVRFDNNSTFGSVFTPRLTLVFQANEAWKLSANSGKTWRAPTFNELYYRDSWGGHGDPDLKPEEGVASDCGVEYATRLLRAAVTGFYVESKNLIQWNYTTPQLFPEQVGKSRQRGVEVEMSQKLVGGLFHKMNYTYLWAEDLDKGVQLEYRPRNVANYTISYLTAWNMKASVMGQYTSARKTANASVPELDEYVTVDLSVSQKISDFEVWAKAENLADKKYQTRLGYPLPGMTLAAGVTLKFWE